MPVVMCAEVGTWNRNYKHMSVLKQIMCVSVFVHASMYAFLCVYVCVLACVNYDRYI